MNKNQIALILAVLALLIAAVGFFGIAAPGGAALVILCVAVIVLAA